MSRSFTVDSDKLQAVIDQFSTQAEVAKVLHARLVERLVELRPADEPVRAILENDILPRLAKLQDGLARSNEALAAFLTDMTAIQPALDNLIERLPDIERAREKITTRLALLAGQADGASPDDLLKRLHTIVSAQGSNENDDSTTDE